MIYDAENHAVSSTNGTSSGTYTYDGNGHRVKKVSGATTTVYIFSGSKDLAEYENGAPLSTPTREFVYAGSSLIANVASGYYYHQDHLSNRLVTDLNHNVATQLGHFPFGETWYETGAFIKWNFTTYERDAESGNDYAQARYYVNRLALFSVLDPLSGDITDPQTLNRYDYVRNDPISFVDPTGMFLVFYPDDGDDGGGGDPSGGDPCFLYGLDCPSQPNPPVGPGGGNNSGNSSAGGQGPQKPQNNVCTTKILSAVNNQFGTNFTADNVQLQFPNGQATNLNILGTSLPAAQFNSIQTGRYPLSPLTYLIGYGATLHVTGQTFFDPAPATFTNSNIGGATSVLFTAHIDSSFAYNPIGALIHLFRDLLHIGGPRNPCP